jgi:hypothetical protein
MNNGMLRYTPILAAALSLALVASPAFAKCDVDTDKDGVCDALDNCPKISNPKQEDSDKDGIGDACDTPPKVDADCSPGYYKNHPEEWCSTYVGTDSPSDPSYPGSSLSKNCAEEEACDMLLQQLNDHTPRTGAAIREGAKLSLDNCFETAEASPCEDDD